MTHAAAILGAGGHARVVVSILRALEIPVLGCFDDDTRLGQSPIKETPLLGRCDDIEQHRKNITHVYLGIGDNQVRAKMYSRATGLGFSLPALVHPAARVEADASIGPGTVVCLGAIVATGASVGCGCILNTGCVLDHESSLGDFVHLAPRSVIAGRTKIGQRSFIGMGAAVAQCLTLGSAVTIGANAVVLRDVPDSAKIVGVHH